MTSISILSGRLTAIEQRQTENGFKITYAQIESTSSSPNDPPFVMPLRWFGDYGETEMARFQVGDRVVVRGRLTLDKVDRGGKYKEVDAYIRLSAVTLVDELATPPTSAPAPREARSPSPEPAPQSPPKSVAKPKAPALPAADEVPEYDDIPF